MAWNLPGTAHPRFKNLAGQRFGRLIVLAYVGPSSEGAIWSCRCDCGKELSVRGKSLRTGNTRSCGCLFLESLIVNPRALKHGQCPEWQSWASMIRRCHEAGATGFKNYGGRGISVCDRWRGPDGFTHFLADLGNRPLGHELDRKDNDGNYCPENCRWATSKEQAQNRRDTVLIEFQGRLQCLAAWADELGFNRSTLAYRIASGWPIERALTQATGRTLT